MSYARSPRMKAEGFSSPMVLSSTRHFRRRTDQPQIAWLARARGNPGLLRRISLDTRFRGYDGTHARSFVLLPKRVFSKEDTKTTKVRIIHRGGALRLCSGLTPGAE